MTDTSTLASKKEKTRKKSSEIVLPKPIVPEWGKVISPLDIEVETDVIVPVKPVKETVIKNVTLKAEPVTGKIYGAIAQTELENIIPISEPIRQLKKAREITSVLPQVPLPPVIPPARTVKPVKPKPQEKKIVKEVKKAKVVKKPKPKPKPKKTKKKASKKKKEKKELTCRVCGKTAIETGGIYRNITLRRNGEIVKLKNTCRKCAIKNPEKRET